MGLEVTAAGRGSKSSGALDDTVRSLTVGAFTVPTDQPEADGTMQWDSTTLVLVEVQSDSCAQGIGWTYCGVAAAAVVHQLEDIVVGRPADQPQAA